MSRPSTSQINSQSTTNNIGMNIPKSRSQTPTTRPTTSTYSYEGRRSPASSPTRAETAPNPDVIHAKSLNETSKALERRVESEVKESRSHLRNVFNSLQAGLYVGELERKLKAFLRFKSDTRSILTFFRDVILGLSIQEVDKSLILNMENELVAFESKFEYFEDQEPEKQLMTILDILDVRDKMLFRCCSFLLSRQQLDLSANEHESLSSHSAYCTKEMSNIFVMFKSFRSLSEQIKVLAANAKSDDFKTAELAAKQKHINNLEAELQVKQEECEGLGQKLDLIANSKARLQKVTKQQEEILRLTVQISQLEKSVEELNEKLRKVHQTLGIRSDRLVACEAQLAKLQEMYEQGVLSLQPLVLEQVTKTQLDHREIQALRFDTALGVSRANYTDKRLKECEMEIVEKQAQIEKLAKNVMQKSRELKHAHSEIARINKINLICVAAKLSAEATAKEHIAKSEFLVKKNNELNESLELHKQEILDMEAYIEELQAMVTRAEEAERLAEDQLNLQVGSLEARDHYVMKLKLEVENFKKIGITPEKQLLWDRMEEEIFNLRNQASQTAKQTKASLYKIYELNDQLGREEKLRREAEAKLILLQSAQS